MPLPRDILDLVDDISAERAKIKNRDGGKAYIGCVVLVKGQKCVLCDWLQPV